MADVILVFPETSYRDRNTTGRMLPLAVLQVAAPLVQQGRTVKIIDQRVTPTWREQLRDEVRRGDAVCVGISSMTGPQILGGIEAASLVRNVAPRLPIVWGGVHPSLEPRQTIEDEHVDIVVIGEGEETFSELVHRLDLKQSLEGLAGVYYKNGTGSSRRSASKPNGRVDLPMAGDDAVLPDHIHANPERPMPELDKMPWPVYELVNVSQYMDSAFHRGRGLAMVTSRGCPYRCAYCYVQSYFSRRWKARSAESVVDHMARLKRDYDINLIFLLDDEFFIDQRRVAKIAALLERTPLNLTIENANMTIREVLRYDEELLQSLHRHGLRQLFLGVETGTDEMMDKISRDITVDAVVKANLKLRRVGITPIYSWMTGFPGETIWHTRQTLQLMRRLLQDNPQTHVYSLNIYSPYPGTPLYEKCKEDGMQSPQKLIEWTRTDCLEPYAKQSGVKERAFYTKAQIMTTYIDRKIWQHQRGIKGWLKRLYSRVVQFRIKHDWYGLMPEIALLRVLRMRYRQQYMD